MLTPTAASPETKVPPELDEEPLEEELDDDPPDELEEELLVGLSFFESEQAATESATLRKQTSFIALEHEFKTEPRGIFLLR